MYEIRLYVYFFFQAEDGIRDIGVTGVQTCALPIWVLPPRVLSFEREGNFDLSDGKNVHAQPCKQLFEQPVQHEEQRLQQVHRRLQVHVLFKIRWKIFGDQRMSVRALRQPPPAEPFLSESLDNRNFRESSKFFACTDAPTRSEERRVGKECRSRWSQC